MSFASKNSFQLWGFAIQKSLEFLDGNLETTKPPSAELVYRINAARTTPQHTHTHTHTVCLSPLFFV